VDSQDLVSKRRGGRTHGRDYKGSGLSRMVSCLNVVC
jgi:hypothetical protein